MTSYLRPTGEERIGTGSFFHLDRLTFETPDGSLVAREVVRHPGAVAFLPLDGTNVILIRQFRVAVGEAVLEIPAGKLDQPGEDLVEAVRRECEEEIGMFPNRVASLGWVYASPGFTDERMHLFTASNLEPREVQPHGIEEEHAEVVRLPFTEAVAMVRDGTIFDAKTRLAIALVALGLP